MVRAEMAKEFKSEPIYIKAIQLSTTPSTGILNQSWDCVHETSTLKAGMRAYEEAGIKNPREEINLIELHDCFSINELLTYECLNISPFGKAKEDVQSGFYDLDGKIPCQSDGGLKCFGHPIGASGIRMAYEIYKQLQGKAEPVKRQIKGNLALGLTHNLGGICGSTVCSVSIFGNEL
jgi:acetyl-CoA C-acetyltransferase